MKIALTGGSGGLGRAITEEALAKGHSVVSIDRARPKGPRAGKNLRFVQANTDDYDKLVRAFAGCDALIHMAAIPSPRKHPNHIVHNNNVVGSYNALRAAVENGIMRICQASSVNAIGHSYSRDPRYDYFPIDEEHPNYGEDPYSLSKWICEAQADNFARRYEDIRIASMRFHWVVPDRAKAARRKKTDDRVTNARHLWAYTRFDAAARACLMSLDAGFTGHEAFYIVAPDTAANVPTMRLAAKFFPKVPIRGDLSGRKSFFNSSKAERLLGWTHDEKPARRSPAKRAPSRARKPRL